VHERDVVLHDLARAELLRQTLVRLVRLGGDDQPRRVAVEPVHDARPRVASARGELPEMKSERVGERAPRDSGRGVDDEAGGLVDDDD